MPRAVAVALLVANLQMTVAVTPVAKVIDLLKNLKQEVEDTGKREAATYDKFSCFCKSSTATKAKEVTRGADKIDELSADIEAKSAEKKEKQETITERKAKQESMSAELDEEKSRCLQEEAEYDAKSAELTKAIGGIKEALKSLKDARPGASLLDLHPAVRQSLEFAQAQGLELASAAGRREASAFLQKSSSLKEDPEYKFHSGGIVSILKMLQTDYGKKKKEVDSEWTKTDGACKQTKETLAKDLKNNKDAITKLSEKASGLAKDIAQAKEDLVSEQTSLEDAQAYLKDLTDRCEARAKDWDQRSSTRDEESQALSRALKILTGRVKGADEAANKRALLLSPRRPVLSKLRTALASTDVSADSSDDADTTEMATEFKALDSTGISDRKPVVNMPTDENAEDVTAWLHGGAFLQVNSVAAQAGELSLEKRRSEQVLAELQQEGRRLGSTALTSLALRVAGDPFGKVKGLIQQLLERLLKESAGEATKKGFCDAELAKTKLARDYSMEEANKLSSEIAVLEVNKERLDTEAGELKDGIAALTKEFAEAKTLREGEKKDNLESLAKGKEGLEAVNEAYHILKSFYKKAGGSAVFLQASPVDEDAPDAPEGDYKGSQGASSGILGLLQVIVSDFERSLRSTEADEKKGAADFEQAKQNFEADKAAHTTKRELDMQDAQTTASTIKKKMKDTKFAMDSVDANLKTLEDLKPTCMESGRMSFKERTQKREDEMAALKNALCKLDTEGVEGDCK